MRNTGIKKFLANLAHIFNGLVLAFVIWYGVWFISSGRYPNFHFLENYYVDFSQALLKGQVALLQNPDPRLAALSDPHEAAGSGIPFLWDVSYFHGKYYIYWGPSPALFYVVYQLIKGEPGPAQLGVLTAYIGIALVLTAFLYVLRRRFFPRAPIFSIGIFLLAACLSPAYAFLLERPLTYETAILSGQLFLFSGLFAWLLFLVSKKGWLLILSGLFWGLAVLARYDTLISVLVYVCVALLYIWITRPVERAAGREHTARNALFLLAPLAICALVMEFYNVVRFGSPLETGLRYQLTSPVEQYYSPQFVLTNLYVYLLQGNPVMPEFPFVTIKRFQPKDLPHWASAAPAKQFDFGFFGLFHSTPIFWFEAFALLLLVGIWLAGRVGARRTAGGLAGAALPAGTPAAVPVTGAGRLTGARSMTVTGVRNRLQLNSNLPLLSLGVMLFLAGLLQLAFLLFYYYSAVRFLSDFFLPLLAGGFLIILQVDCYLYDRAWLRGIYWFGLVFLALQSATIGFFSGFNLFPYYFSHHNRPLYEAFKAKAAIYQNVIYAFLKPDALPGRIARALLH